jgi:hypothetical protein
MNSTEHRDNILNAKYRYTGVAVVLDGSTAWNTFDFVDTYHSSTHPASTPSQPKPKPAPSSAPPAPATAGRPVAALAVPATTTAHVPAPQTAAATAPRHHARSHRVAQPVPHTGVQRAADELPNLARMLSARSQHTAVLAASVRSLSPSLPPSSRLSIALAGLLVGFVAVRWWQAARGGSRAPRDLVTA